MGLYDAFRDVIEFRRKLGLSVGGVPADIPEGPATLHACLIEEEMREMTDAMARGDLPGIADGAIDSIYVILGTLAEYGIDPSPVWHAVQAANLAKAGGPVRADGKRLKPPGWLAPEVAAILAAQPSIAGATPAEAGGP